jgi:hypothetical protein
MLFNLPMNQTRSRQMWHPSVPFLVFFLLLQLTSSFGNSYELHQISCATTKNNLWLPSITLYGGPINLCTTCWTIIHASRFTLYIWLRCLGNILHPCLHPIWHLQACQLNMIQTSKLCGVISPFAEGNSTWTKNWGHPPTCFLHVNGILFFSKKYKDEVTLCMHPTSSHLHMPMYTTFDLLHGKCNMMPFEKSLWKISQWCTAFMMFMNAHANFTWFHPKAISCVCHSILGPLIAIAFNCP